VGALACMVLFGATDGGIPLLIKHVLDGVFARQDQRLLYILPVALVIFTVVRALLDFGQQFLMCKLGHLVVRDLRNRVNSHLLTLAPGYFVRNSTANLLARVTSDVLLVRSLLTDTLAAVIRDSIRVVALLSAAVYLDPLLALIAFVVFPIGIYPIVRFGKRMRKLSRMGQEAIGSVSALLQESMLGNRVVKIFGREKFEEQRFTAANQQLTNTFIKSERIRALTGPINEVLASFAISGVLLYGGLTVIQGTRTQGDFLAFLVAVFLLYDPFKKLSRINSNVQQGLAGAERIFEVLDTVPSIREPLHPKSLGAANSVVFEAVSFSYAEGGVAALRDISLSIAPGQRVALVGFSGSGKSTLTDLVPRFVDPGVGRVLIGGVDIAQVSLHELRSRVAVVGQHTFLFNDTILSNIGYGREDATRAEIEDAARAAFAYDFIMALPDGFETMVGEAGHALSGGERQRVAIARAILKAAPILILDEATASLDNRAEREVQRALEELAKNRTSIVVAHRLSTIHDADLIVVMRDGQIVEQGRHEELIAHNGEYARLHALQFREPSTPISQEALPV